MKTFVLIFFTLLSLKSVHADSVTIERTEGEITYTIDSSHKFNELEIQGVQYHAGQKAIAACQAKGLMSCAMLSSTIQHCNSEYAPVTCSAKAIAQGFRLKEITIQNK